MRPLALGISIAASLGAAAIHFALGPHHLEELGALGLGFYLAGTLQVALPAALFVARDRIGGSLRRIVLAGVAVNVAILAAWAISRVVGLPAGAQPWMPEAIGVADSISAALEILIIAAGLLLLRRAPSGSERLQDRRRSAQSLALGPAVALIAVATSFAVLSPEGVVGHGADGHAHVSPDAHALEPAPAPTGKPEAGEETAPRPEPSVETAVPAAQTPDGAGEVDAEPGHADGEKTEPHGH